jgi:polar amino acid transport system substrate-binding protein
MSVATTSRRALIALCAVFGLGAGLPAPADAQAPAAAPQAQASDTLQRILREGRLRIGVRADYRPWGFRNPAGEFEGMEIQMARDVARTLGVQPESSPWWRPTGCSSWPRARST